jgi:hypothetical protein
MAHHGRVETQEEDSLLMFRKSSQTKEGELGKKNAQISKAHQTLRLPIKV